MRKFVFICITLVIGSSCNLNQVEVDNLKVQNYRGLVALPIGELNYSLQELLEEEIDSTNLQIGPDSVFVLVYRDSTSFNDNSQLLDIQDITNTGVVTVPVQAPVPVATPVPINQDFTFNYQPENDEEIDSIVYENGELSFQLSSSFESSIDFDVTINNTVNLGNGNPVVFRGTVSPNDVSRQTQSLANHATNLNRVGNLNTFEVSFTGTINLQAGQGISATDILSFTLIYRDQVFRYVFGFFGQDNVEVGNQLVDVSFFENLGEGLIFENPEIRMTFMNSYGLPIGLLFNTIFSVSGDTGDSTFLSGQIVQSPQLIASPTVNQIGQVLDTTLSITSNNSNIRDLFSVSPRQLGFQVRALTNPFGTSTRNFVSNNSRLDTDIEVRLPLSVRLEDLTRSLDFEIDQGLDLSDVDSVTLRIVTENQLPLNARMTLQILDADSVVLHEVPEELVVATPFLNRNGVVVTGEVNIASILLNPAGIQAFQDGSILRFSLLLNTPETLTSQEIFVDFLAQYAIEVKLSIIARLDAPL